MRDRLLFISIIIRFSPIFQEKHYSNAIHLCAHICIFMSRHCINSHALKATVMNYTTSYKHFRFRVIYRSYGHLEDRAVCMLKFLSRLSDTATCIFCFVF